MAILGGAFRRKIGDEVWHTSEACTFWPESGAFIEINKTPDYGSHCNECKAKSAQREDREDSEKGSMGA